MFLAGVYKKKSKKYFYQARDPYAWICIYHVNLSSWRLKGCSDHVLLSGTKKGMPLFLSWDIFE